MHIKSCDFFIIYTVLIQVCFTMVSLKIGLKHLIKVGKRGIGAKDSVSSDTVGIEELFFK